MRRHVQAGGGVAAGPGGVDVQDPERDRQAAAALDDPDQVGVGEVVVAVGVATVAEPAGDAGAERRRRVGTPGLGFGNGRDQRVEGRQAGGEIGCRQPALDPLEQRQGQRGLGDRQRRVAGGGDRVEGGEGGIGTHAGGTTRTKSTTLRT